MSTNYGYWEFGGKNGLEGKISTQVELPDGRILTQKDPDLPAVLEDSFILYALRTSRIARNDFTRLFPTLDEDSQDRLTTLILRNKRASSLILDDQAFADALQHNQVTAGVRTRLSRAIRT